MLTPFAILVVLSIILAALSYWQGPLLAVAVILLGAALLIGGTR